jgi:ankyrin repeat protein
MLLKRGAVVDAQSNEGMDSIYWAVQLDNTQVVRLLLEHGADLNVRDKLGGTPSRLGTSRDCRTAV